MRRSLFLILLFTFCFSMAGCDGGGEPSHIDHWVYDEEATTAGWDGPGSMNAEWHGGTALTISPDGRFSMALVENPGEIDDIDILGGIWVASRDYIVIRIDGEGTNQDMKCRVDGNVLTLEAPKAWGQQPIYIFKR
ncbi:MAG: hypothetical protein MK085_07345 [Phycisphaerales bacterium]|nr:hypothetical protein [Phycisphaerales bacterium]